MVETGFHVDPATFPELDARQFGTGLWQDGLISYDDAKAFMGAGTLPAAVVTALNSLDDDDTGKPTPRKEATLLVVGALGYQRANPVVDKLAAATGWDTPTTDAKWRAWALL
jgi:hypothetical protein